MTLLEQLTQQAEENGGNVSISMGLIIDKLFTHQIKLALGSLQIILEPYEYEDADVDTAFTILHALLPEDLRITMKEMASQDGINKARILQKLLAKIREELTSKEN